MTAEELARRVFVQLTAGARWEMVLGAVNDGTLPLYEVDALNRRVVLHFHKGQLPAWESDRRFVFMIAGKQGGKTIFGPPWLKRQIDRLGAGDYLAISATYDLFSLKMLPALKQFFCNDLGIGHYWGGLSKIIELCDPATGKFGAKHSYDHEKMWGRIILRSADSEKGLQSATGLAAWVDEPGMYAWDVWKDIRGRLSLNAGTVLGTTTIYNLGWLKQQIYDPWLAGDDEIEVVQFTSRDNPFFSEAEWESLRRSLPKHQFDMDYGAEFGRPPAAIYEDFIDADRDQGGHKCKRFVVPIEWPRMVAIDPGVINPGKIWVAHDTAQNVFYVYRAEKGGERRTSKEHAKYDLARAAKNQERVIWWAIGAKSEKYWREDYRSAGAKSVREPDIQNVGEGIDRAGLLIREHRLYVMDDEVEFVDEILRYSRDIKDGEVQQEIKDKSSYHLMDALRYFAVQVVKGTGETRKAGTVSYA